MPKEKLIECIAKENYVHYQQSIRENMHNFKDKTIVIFGAGIIGLQFSYILESTSVMSFLFCDNNSEKWGTVLNGHEVISPKQLIGKEDRYFVFLAMEIYEECARQLEEMGYHKNENWCNLTNVSEEQLISDFCSAAEKKILILGDCVTSIVGITEKKKVSLRDLLMQDSDAQVLGLNGLYMRAYYMLLLMLLEKTSLIKKVVLLLDISIFYEKYHLFPKNQHSDVMKRLRALSGLETEEMSEFINTIEKRAKETSNLYMVSPERNKQLSSEQIEQGRMMHMRLNQMFSLREDSESMLYLRKFLNLCKDRDVDVTVVVFPVNYELGEQYFHEKFYERYSAICNGIKKCVIEVGANWLDLSFLLSKKDFITLRSVSEGVREKGREKIAEAIKNVLYN